MGVASNPSLTFSFTTTTLPTRSALHQSYHRHALAGSKPSSFRSSCATFDWRASVYVQRIYNLDRSRSLRGSIAHKVCCSLLKVEEDINDEACELVSGSEVSIGEGVDTIGAYLFKAVKNNNGIGILLLSDVFGFEDAFTRDFAYRVACNGYNVLVPDLFRGEPWSVDQPKTMFEQWRAEQEPQRVASDIDTSAKWLVDELMAAGISKKLGIIGFCFGGGRVLEETRTCSVMSVF
ncbi:hypothetical protein K2173_009050 [Erythroxylum novogranatense]|uniref:Carboxymethylenebutenolidase homolog n=1 Tax=Erythroxylum novogranatense TaxID=1862640 RepID=A0AAV8TW63_9ROSI|nr:hypothetical protein K2173_009050 [Erythroxylum novogranatense]